MDSRQRRYRVDPSEGESRVLPLKNYRAEPVGTSAGDSSLEFTRHESVAVPTEDYALVRAADVQRIRRRLETQGEFSGRWRSAAWGTLGIGASVACTGLTVSDWALATSPVLWTVAIACLALAICFGFMQLQTSNQQERNLEELAVEIDEATGSPRPAASVRLGRRQLRQRP
jgi:hypothetical protein